MPKGEGRGRSKNSPHPILVRPEQKGKFKQGVRIIKKIGGDADIAVFPEYMMSYAEGGLSKDWLNSQAEDLNGDFISKLSMAAKEVGLWLLINMFERVKIESITPM